jgi:DMSO/TMAO reductase YedYZ molybdopterin-dependent catalytic subunit
LQVDGLRHRTYNLKYADRVYRELAVNPEPHIDGTAATPLPQSPIPAVHNTPAPLRALGRRHLPAAEHFRREHFPMPEVDPGEWRLTLAGAVRTPAIVTPAELRSLPLHTQPVVLECAGHRRSELRPPTPGLQWGVGAVSEAVWAGVRLRDVLTRAGLARDAREVVLQGADRGPFDGLEGTHSYARSLPLRKALDPDTILAVEMNGEPIPPEHGGPVRAIVPGWYATDSVKWLERIQVSADEFDGPFQALDYRFATIDEPGPGARMERMPVHSLVTDPAGAAVLDPGTACVRGIAWSGGGAVTRVDVRIDDGPWRAAAIVRRSGRHGRTFWETAWTAVPGTHTIAVRARDASGAVQPEEPVWNRRGYVVNAVHRLTVTVREERDGDVRA